VVGDCYFDDDHSFRAASRGSDDKEAKWQGSLPRELLPLPKVFNGMISFRQVKGERVYLM